MLSWYTNELMHVSYCSCLAMQVTSLRQNSCTALGIHLLSTLPDSRIQPMVSWRDTAMATQHSSWKEVCSVHVHVVSVFFPHHCGVRTFL